MIVISINVKPYIARYAMRRYSCNDGAVLLPAHSVALHAIYNRLQRRPSSVVPRSGNLRVMLREGVVEKDLTRNNYLSASAERHIDRLLTLDFDMTLHEYMDKQYYQRGIDYEISAEAFHAQYDLGETLTTGALLKKHIRWKKVRRGFRRQEEQGEISFDF